MNTDFSLNKPKIIFLILAASGIAGFYYLNMIFPGKTLILNSYFTLFTLFLFIIFLFIIKKVNNLNRKYYERLCLDLENTESLQNIEESGSRIVELIHALKKKNQESENKITGYKAREELYIKEFNLLLENLKEKKTLFTSVKKQGAEIAVIVQLLLDFKNSLIDFDRNMSTSSGSQIDSITNLSIVIKNLVESIDKESRITSRAEMVSKEMSNTVKTGGDEITKTIALISEIEKLSLKINEIIAVIDNISEKTNLLAMNAAIEAAHAGDAGKGFSVVAGEIQKLSKETTSSSKRISDLVKSVTDTIKVMTSNAQNASGGLKAIMDAVNRTGSIIADITGAINEQSEGGNIIMNASGNLYKSAEKIKLSSEMNAGNIDSFSKTLEAIKSISTSLESSMENLSGRIEKSEKSILTLIEAAKV